MQVNGRFTSPEFQAYRETVSTVAIAAGALTLNLASGNHFSVALNANVTSLSFANVPSSGATAAIVYFTADGTQRSVTWPASVKWASGSAPTMTATNGKVDIFSFITKDGGASWYALIVGQNF